MSRTEKDKHIIVLLSEIEDELKLNGFWSENPPDIVVSNFTEAPTFERWLQCVFLPNAKIAASRGEYPAKSQVGLMAIREYDYHDYVEKAQGLIRLLSNFDALVEGE